MKTKRLFSVLILARLLPLTALADVWQDPETKVNYTYTVGKSDASVTAGTNSKAGSPDATGDITILSKINIDGTEYSVKRIGTNAFYKCSDLTSVTIPSSVISIDDYAFSHCSKLNNVTTSEGLNSIGYYAFDYCGKLTSFTIPESVTSIGTEAFAYCSGLTSITIPKSVNNIGNSPYTGCSGLTKITVAEGNENYDSRENCNAIIQTATNELINGCKNTVIPSTITSIGDYAFYRCYGLTSITIPENVTSIGRYAFRDSGWENNQPDGLLYLNKWLLGHKGYDGLTGDLVIAEGTKGIAGGAFEYYNGLTSVTIPSSLRYICRNPFQECRGLNSVRISDLEAWCKVKLEYSNSSPLYYAKHLYLNGKEITNLIIPEGITSIELGAFMNCIGLVSVTFPSSVTEINNYAFYGCSGLTQLVIPSSVKNIRGAVFCNCTSLTNVTLPEGVTQIGGSAFYGCTNLTSINIPESVNQVGVSAFKNSGWYKNQPDGLLYFNKWLLGYKGSEPEGELIIDKGTKGIAYGSFKSCTGLTSINMPKELRYINGEAFYGCNGLTSISIPEGVTSIGIDAFAYCGGLTSVTIPSSVTSIEKEGFYSCSKLASVTSLIQEPFEISERVFQYYDSSSYPYSYKFTTATLYVPEGTKEKYEATSAWNQFHSIEEIESTAIDDAIARKGESNETEHYDLSGRRVSESQRGLNIVRQADGTVRKVIVK